MISLLTSFGCILATQFKQSTQEAIKSRGAGLNLVNLKKKKTNLKYKLLIKMDR